MISNKYGKSLINLNRFKKNQFDFSRLKMQLKYVKRQIYIKFKSI